MNDRIKELADQAGADVWGDEVAASQYFDIEKFAELIVRECADIGERYADGNYEIPRQILARFGMDEDEE